MADDDKDMLVFWLTSRTPLRSKKKRLQLFGGYCW